MLSFFIHSVSTPRRADIDFGGSGGAVRTEPVNVGSRSLAEQLPALDPSPPFLLFHHPRQWRIEDVEGVPVLLPVIQHIAVEPGIGNVDEYGDPSIMITQRRRDGWILIPEDWARTTDTPDGASGYVRRVKGRKGSVHLTAWQGVKVLAGAPVWKVDEVGLRVWLLRLVSEGLLPAPEPEVLTAMRERAAERVQRAGSRDVRGNAAAAALLQRAERELALLERAEEGGVAALQEEQERALEEKLVALRAKRGISNG